MSIELKKANEYEKTEQEKIPVEEKPAFHVAAPVGWINDPKQLPVPSYLTRKLKGQFQHACPSHLYSLIAETEKKQ